MQVVVYGAAACPKCTLVKQYLTQKGLDFDYVDVRENPEGMIKLDELKVLSIPVVTHNGKLISVGFETDKLLSLCEEVLNVSRQQ